MRIRSIVRVVLCIGAVGLTSSRTGAAPAIVSTFDTGLEGWTAQGSGFVQFNAAGNPGGSAEFDRFTNTPDLYAVAPAAFTGNLSGYDNETFSFDARTTNVETGGTVAGFGTISLYHNGSGTPYTQDIAPGVPSTTWQTYSGPFTAAGFGVSQANWTTALSQVDQLTIYFSPYSTTQAFSPTLLDNVILTPEPVSMGMVALAAGMLLKRTARRRG